ncbi:MAG: ABC transporter permease subunit [Deltaproteobacteria bacterium]|nr:ABC transporter permease subunit [Deltaproteobacteria bacterium]
MSKALTIAWRDFRSYFVSPIGFVIIAVFILLMGWLFTASLADFQRRSLEYVQYSRMQFGDLIQPPNLNHMFMNVLGNMGVIFLFLAPIITMRLLAEEKKTGTMELLLTSPLRTAEIIFGKFFAALLLFSLILLLSSPLPVILFLAGNPALGPVLTGYLGLFLMGASFLALGLLFSAITENQIIAASLTFGCALFFWIINWIAANANPTWEKILSYLSIIPHLGNFIRGLLDLQDGVYYLSFIALALFLAHRVLLSRTV